MAKVYECHNPRCQLGGPEPGRFTGGITAAHANILTGAPVPEDVEPETVAEGYCPNCAEQGVETDVEHVSLGAENG